MVQAHELFVVGSDLLTGEQGRGGMKSAEQDTLDSGAADEFDYVFYRGEIGQGLVNRLTKLIGDHQRFQHLKIAMVTPGGDPDAAFRAARFLQRRYKTITLLVPSHCKSAGTLFALGAHHLAFSDLGELGPLDMQLRKRDEIGERESGATVLSAIDVLHDRAFALFETFMLQILNRSEGSLSAKMATHVASEVTKGIYESVFRQIDPHHLGETQRAMTIGMIYGERLAKVSRNIEDSGIERLVSGYPSHGFVIDVDEALDIFQNVRSINEFEMLLIHSSFARKEALTFAIMDAKQIADIEAQISLQKAARTSAHEDQDHASVRHQEAIADELVDP